MFKRKFWFTGIAAVFFLSLSGLNTVRADVPGWFWNTLFTWAASVADEVDALEAEVAALEAQLDAEVSALEAQLDAEVGALEAQVAALQAVDNIAAYLEVDTSDPSKPVVRIVGANFQVVNGLGNTETKNGVGNLIVGYDEGASFTRIDFCSDGSYADESTCLSANETWDNNQKSGSHYIVGGTGNSYTQSGGLVVGYENASNAIFSSISAGAGNTASGYYSSVSGGLSNTASNGLSSVSGGQNNTASRLYSSVSGGLNNIASGLRSSVSGGAGNIASGDWGSVSGGISNTAAGDFSSVSGGEGGFAPGMNDWRAGSLWEDD